VRVSNIFLALVACIGSLTGCEQQAETSEDVIITQTALDALIVEHPMFSGSVIISQDGEITASVHTGYADRESGKLNDAQTLHSVSSVGKMFTAVAIVQLVDLGRLAYETPVIDIIPELSDQISNAITVDHLLQHRSGLERMSGLDDATLNALRNNADYFALILSSGIHSVGPSDFSYRNENFQILGEIIERVSGQPYKTYIRENIADPVDMAGPVFVRRIFGVSVKTTTFCSQ